MRFLLLLLPLLGLPGRLSAQSAEPLRLKRTIPLPGVRGRIDHMSADVEGRRLFVAALGNDSVEVVDVRTGKRTRSLTGFNRPQGVLFVRETNRLAVANGGNGRVDILDGKELQPLTRLFFDSDADNLRFDSVTREILVGHGDGVIGILDAASGVERRQIKLEAHPESFQLIPYERRLFVNLPAAGRISIADPDRMKVVVDWPNPAGLAANFAMAVDAQSGRLYVAYRHPARLAAFDAKSGKLLSQAEMSEDCDDLFFDSKRKRIYAICGEGFVDVFEGTRRVAKVRTAEGARTGFFIRETSRLYVGVPARGSRKAGLQVYEAAR